jgi:hypothetical protein
MEEGRQPQHVVMGSGGIPSPIQRSVPTYVEGETK